MVSDKEFGPSVRDHAPWKRRIGMANEYMAIRRVTFPSAAISAREGDLGVIRGGPSLTHFGTFNCPVRAPCWELVSCRGCFSSPNAGRAFRPTARPSASRLSPHPPPPPPPPPKPFGARACGHGYFIPLSPRTPIDKLILPTMSPDEGRFVALPLSHKAPLSICETDAKQPRRPWS